MIAFTFTAEDVVIAAATNHRYSSWSRVRFSLNERD